MALDPDILLNHDFGVLEHSYSERDSALYALGVGLGFDPLDEAQLKFVYEDGMAALPTMAVVLAYPGFWLKEPWTGVDWVRVLHGEQGIRIHRPLPPAATVVGRTRVTAIVDKGAEKGALIYSEREVSDKETGELLCTLTQSGFARGDGKGSIIGTARSEVVGVRHGIPVAECPPVAAAASVFPFVLGRQSIGPPQLPIECFVREPLAKLVCRLRRDRVDRRSSVVLRVRFA